MSPTLLQIPGTVLQESPNSHESIKFLTKVLNTGYDVVKHKFNVITSTRIKNENIFIEDLGIQAKGSFILLLIRESDEDSTKILKDLSNGDINHVIADNTLSFNNIEESQILGTIAAKAKHLDTSFGWEITGFTSFVKGVGKFLINQLEIKARQTTEPKVDSLFASVIVEHQLIPYYTQFGFIEIGEKVLLRIDENGKVKGEALEDGIYATRDFHVGLLKKTIEYV
ncbi:Sporulation protein [Wickerhamomyces ciferrii]|uniref:Sporulation protein n=1 Tax=Wickerhamomyces ciferrii (strain ATCC 14091 / BCRC 22168 / CBS 111 / JCM 3599 / NBRC 0793 / NRRL Y-1031 F-60-10) TaxID=1206466 RepID=K0KIR8_WICCF|nr:Sporulation protein [Wickerhamomyces ciferrii]CCH41289.1 Sporulation protein [Wickerhamomyces ciferrii]